MSGDKALAVCLKVKPLGPCSLICLQGYAGSYRAAPGLRPEKARQTCTSLLPNIIVAGGKPHGVGVEVMGSVFMWPFLPGLLQFLGKRRSRRGCFKKKWSPGNIRSETKHSSEHARLQDRYRSLCDPASHQTRRWDSSGAAQSSTGRFRTPQSLPAIQGA